MDEAVSYRFSRFRDQRGTFHVWGRAFGGVRLFRDAEDRATFEWMIARHVSPAGHRDSRGRPYAFIGERVGVIALNCLSTHFHLVLWQRHTGGIDQLMRRVLHAYTKYYNAKYETDGSLFPGPFRARPIHGRKALEWKIGYVHKNHKRLGLDWEFSTHRYYVSGDPPDWLQVEKTLEIFGGPAAYRDYMRKYQLRAELDEELRVDEPWI